MTYNVIDTLDEKESAKLLALAVQTLRNWRCTRKGPPYFKIGRSVRYSRQALLDYREGKKITPEMHQDQVENNIEKPEVEASQSLIISSGWNENSESVKH